MDCVSQRFLILFSQSTRPPSTSIKSSSNNDPTDTDKIMMIGILIRQEVFWTVHFTFNVVHGWIRLKSFVLYELYHWDFSKREGINRERGVDTRSPFVGRCSVLRLTTTHPSAVTPSPDFGFPSRNNPLSRSETSGEWRRVRGMTYRTPISSVWFFVYPFILPFGRHDSLPFCWNSLSSHGTNPVCGRDGTGGDY